MSEAWLIHLRRDGIKLTMVARNPGGGVGVVAVLSFEMNVNMLSI